MWMILVGWRMLSARLAALLPGLPRLCGRPGRLTVCSESGVRWSRDNLGALYLLPREFKGEPNGDDLTIVASRTEREPKYHKLSKFLATTVLREGEAVLARNVEDDSRLGSRDSHGEIHATSVICAPIRQDGFTLTENRGGQ